MNVFASALLFTLPLFRNFYHSHSNSILDSFRRIGKGNEFKSSAHMVFLEIEQWKMGWTKRLFPLRTVHHLLHFWHEFLLCKHSNDIRSWPVSSKCGLKLFLCRRTGVVKKIGIFYTPTCFFTCITLLRSACRYVDRVMQWFLTSKLKWCVLAFIEWLDSLSYVWGLNYGPVSQSLPNTNPKVVWKSLENLFITFFYQ